MTYHANPGRSRPIDVAGAAHLCVIEGVSHLDPQAAMFQAMQVGWERQQQSRLLKIETISQRLGVLKRFGAFTNDYPWNWKPSDVDDFTSMLQSGQNALAPSTLRGYHHGLRQFCDFITDPRYGWATLCEERFGTFPMQIFSEANTATHNAEYEAKPGRRPLQPDELQAFFDYADAEVSRITAAGRKGSLAAFRDAVAFKVIYAWGLRRREAVMLDIADCHPNAEVPSFGTYGSLHVRFAKASKTATPRRRTVLSVFEWAVECLEEYVSELRPLFDPATHPALWVTERRTRLSGRHLDERFATYRDALGLPEELNLHCLRHSYVTHLIEAGYPERFVQEQVGHSYASTTAIYTSVSSDFKNRVLRQALSNAFPLQPSQSQTETTDPTTKETVPT